jgi:hypothetical protein
MIMCRILFTATVLGFFTVSMAPCQAQWFYVNPSNIDHDDYGQGYYGGFGRRINGYFPGSYTAYGNSVYGYTPGSSAMFPKYYGYYYGGVPNYRYHFATPYYPPIPTPYSPPAYNEYGYYPYGYYPYVYDPYRGW